MDQHGKHRALVIRAAAFALALWAGTAQGTCRQALALGLDVSGSVDGAEYALQVQGLANALTSAEVQATLLSLPEAPVRLAVYEWSSRDFQRLILPWTTVVDENHLSQIAATIGRTKRADAPPATGLGTAMRYGINLLSTQTACWKRTLDISGDGKNNSGHSPKRAMRDVALQDITINGLIIGVDAPVRLSMEDIEIGELSAYYRANVLRGPGAFLETALGFEDFERAMKKKLLRELEFAILSTLGPRAIRDQ